MEQETDSMEMPCPCEHCKGWFDLNDGYGSDKWYPDVIICAKCHFEEEREIERDEEIEELQNDLSDAVYTVNDSRTRLAAFDLNPDKHFTSTEVKLQAFKDFVHKRLDEAGIPIHPDGEHSKAGCRIGDRLDIVLSNRWIPVEKELPEVEVPVITFPFSMCTIRHMKMDGDYKVWFFNAFPVTHWMPFPAAPTE